jgi:hypothetical protein
MLKNIVKKGFTIAIILLFFAVSFQPIVAKDIIPPFWKSDTKELLETILDIANNKEIQDILQKSEIRGSPIRFQQLLGRLQKEIIGVIEKNDALNERFKQLSDLPCDCEKDNNITSWSFPVICLLLSPLFIFSLMLSIKFQNDYPLTIMWFIGTILKCFWTHL